MSEQISKLTDIQYESVYKIGKNLRDRYLINSSRPMGRVREWIEWIYHCAGRSTPKIIITLNPTKIPVFRSDPRILAATIEKITKERGLYISGKYSWKIRKWMYRVVFDQRYARLKEVIDVGQSIWAAEQRSKVNRFSPASFYASFTLVDRTAAWVADAYRKIDPRFPKSDLYRKVSEFSRFGLFGLTTGRTECWALRLPIEVITHPVQGVPHSASAPAVVWKDGHEQYFLYGVLFPWDIWHGVVTRSFKLKEIQRWSNIERIKSALYYLGPAFLLKQCRSKLIHSTARGNKLYYVRVKLLNLNGFKILCYTCPSTGQRHHGFVPESFDDADSAQAWRFGLSKNEYLKIVES